MTTALIAACRRRGHRLFMFEPNPRRAAELRQKTAGAPSIEVLEQAVSDYNGSATFNIAASRRLLVAAGFRSATPTGRGCTSGIPTSGSRRSSA